MQPESTSRSTGHVQERRLKGGPAFYMKCRLPGEGQTTRKIGPKWTGSGQPDPGYFTRKTAQEFLDDFLADARRKAAAAPPPTASGATFGQACDEYLVYIERERQCEPTTLADYRGVVERYLRKRWGDEPLESIAWQDIDAYKRERLDEGKLSNRTIVRHLVVLHGIFRLAKRRHGLVDNPASAEFVDRPPVRYSGEFQHLDHEQLMALSRAMPDAQESAIVLTAAWSGLRQGELLALRWRDLDFANQKIHVRHSLSGRPGRLREKAPKSGRVRSVPLVVELIPVLDALSRRAEFTGPGDLVFANEAGEHLSSWSLRRHFYAALDDAGLGHLREGDRGFRFHDLRHCFGSTAARAFALTDVQAWMGHAHSSTTERYVHHRPGADDAARLSAAFAALKADAAVAAAESSVAA
jgi:integrase